MKKYLKIYFLSLSFFVLIGAIPIIFLYRSGEYLLLNNVVTKQRQSIRKIIYGAALFDQKHHYKRLLLEASSSRIVTLGSSRVMQFRQHMFLEEFINMGGAMGSINQGALIAPSIIKKKPDIVILGLDFWWFNEKRNDPNRIYIKTKNMNASPTPYHLLKFYEWLLDGKINFKEIQKTILFGGTDIGVASLEKEGYGPDGSYYNTRILIGKKQSSDSQFNKTLHEIESGNGRYAFGLLANEQHVKKFVQLIRLFEKNKINVIIFFPPFPGDVNDLFETMGGTYQYVKDLKKKLYESNIQFYDYTDASIVGSNDCEFLDGLHGGEVTYMRILNDLSRKSDLLKNFVDQKNLQKTIDIHEGKAFVPDDEITSNREIDFLHLGCNK